MVAGGNLWRRDNARIRMEELRNATFRPGQTKPLSCIPPRRDDLQFVGTFSSLANSTGPRQDRTELPWSDYNENKIVMTFKSRSAKPLFGGSIPPRASNKLVHLRLPSCSARDSVCRSDV